MHYVACVLVCASVVFLRMILIYIDLESHLKTHLESHLKFPNSGLLQISVGLSGPAAIGLFHRWLFHQGNDFQIELIPIVLGVDPIRVFGGSIKSTTYRNWHDSFAHYM